AVSASRSLRLIGCPPLHPPFSVVFATLFLLMLPPPPRSTLFPYTTLFRSSPWADIPRLCTAPRTCLSDLSISQSNLITQLAPIRSEEHTSELQSRENLVCRLLLEKKKRNKNMSTHKLANFQ